MALDAAAVTAYADALAVVRGGVTGSLKEIDFAEATRDFILNADVDPAGIPTPLTAPALGGPVTGLGILA